MTGGLTVEGLQQKLAIAQGKTQYRLLFAALLRAEAGVPVEDFIVVGGSAMEVHTLGRYTSGDIDIVARQGAAVAAVLKGWKFQHEARIWTNDDLELVVDLVRPPYTGSLERTTFADTPYGPVRLAGVEDLFVKRLAGGVHTRMESDLVQAQLLAETVGERMDWEYVESFARQMDVLQMARQIRRSVGHGGGRGSGRKR